MDKRLRFFEKDTVPWGQYRSMSFYRILNDLHHRNPPLYNGEFGAPAVQLVEEGDVLYYERSDEKTSVRVVINLSADSVEFAPTGLEGYHTTFNRQNLSKTTWEPWGFEVFVKMTP